MVTPDFFISGGTLPENAASYIERRADQELRDYLEQREFCYVLTSRQMGKSSLMIRTASRLRRQGSLVAIVDLTAIGLNLTAVQWYRGMLAFIGQQLQLHDEMEQRWRELSDLGPVQRWIRVLEDVLLKCTSVPIVLFVDEIDCIVSLPFPADEFLGAIRECYNRRTRQPEFRRLSFCLLGVTTPSDLIRDMRNTPFNVGRRIELIDFTDAEASALAVGLVSPAMSGGRWPLPEAQRLLRRVMYWTSGHPYLTQRLCRQVRLEGSREVREVDRICRSLFLQPGGAERDDNLAFVQDRLVRASAAFSGGDAASLLALYSQIRRGKAIRKDPADRTLSLLLLSGIVRSTQDRVLVRNRIYATAFDHSWVTTHTPHAELRRQRDAYRVALMRTGAVAATAVVVFSGLALWALLSADRARLLGLQAVSLANARRVALERAQRLLYVAQIQSAWQAAEAGDFLRLGTLLAALRDNPELSPLRGWEWRYLWGRGHRARAILDGHSTPVSQVVFARNGTQLLTAGLDQTWLVRDPDTGLPTATLAPGSGAHKWQQAVSPDGCWVLRTTLDPPPRARAGQSYGWKAELVDLRSRSVRPLNSVPAFSSGFVFSPDGTWFAGVIHKGEGREVRLWNTNTGRYRSLPAGADLPSCLAISPDGRRLAVGDRGGAVVLWDAELGHPSSRLPGAGKRAEFLRFRGDGAALAVGYDGPRVTLWEPARCRPLFSFTPGVGSLCALALSPDGRLLAAGTRQPRVWSGPSEIRLWSVDRHRELPPLQGHTGPVLSLAFAPDSARLASGGWDHQVRLWDVRAVSGSRFRTRAGKAVFAMAFSSDGRRLALRGPRYAELWDVGSLQCISSLRQPDSQICVFSRDLNRLAFADRGGVTVRDFAGRQPDTLLALPAPPTALAFDRANRLLAGTAGGGLSVWDARRAVWTRQDSPPHFSSEAFAPAPNGVELAVVGSDACVHRWSVDSRRELGRQLRGPAHGPLEYSPDGNYLAVSGGTYARLWDLAHLHSETLGGLRQMVRSFSFSPDGKTLAIGSRDGGIRFWNVATAQEIGTLPGCALGNRAVAFSPDGELLAVGSEDGSVRLWRAPRE